MTNTKRHLTISLVLVYFGAIILLTTIVSSLVISQPLVLPLAITALNILLIAKIFYLKAKEVRDDKEINFQLLALNIIKVLLILVTILVWMIPTIAYSAMALIVLIACFVFVSAGSWD